MSSSRHVLGLAVTLLDTVFGFLAGGLIAGLFFVGPGDGMAGAATAAILALLGATAGLTVGLVLWVKLERPALLRALLIALVGVLVTGTGVYLNRGSDEASQVDATSTSD